MLPVAGEHDRFFHAQIPQGGNGVPGAGLDFVRNNDVPGVLTVHCHVGHGASRLHWAAGSALQGHELFIAHGHPLAVHLGAHAVAGNFLRAVRFQRGFFLPAGFQQGLGDGVGAERFRRGGQGKQALCVAVIGVHVGHGKAAPGNGAGLVKYGDFGLGQGFQIARAFNEDAPPGRAADAAEKGEGHGNHQGAGAGNHQEGEGRSDPLVPVSPEEQGRYQSGQHGQAHHHGGINAGEAGNEPVGLGLGFPGVLHQLQNAGHGGILVGVGHLHPQHTLNVHAAAEYRVPFLDRPGRAFTGKRHRVQGGRTLQHCPVQGHLFAGADHDGFAHLHKARQDRLDPALPLHVGGIRADVHEPGDGFPAPVHSVVLEKFPDLVQQHHRHRLGVFPDTERAHRSHGHQEHFVHGLAVQDAFQRFQGHRIAHHQPGRHVQGDFHSLLHRQQQPRHEKQPADPHADQHGFPLALFPLAVFVTVTMAVTMLMFMMLMVFVFFLVVMMAMLTMLAHRFDPPFIRKDAPCPCR